MLELLCAVTALVLSPAVATVLLDPGPLCAGELAVLTCSVPDGRFIAWRYDNELAGPIIQSDMPAPSGTFTVLGVEFSLSVLEGNSPDLVSQLSFTASTDMDGLVVLCAGTPSVDGVIGAVTLVDLTLQVQMFNDFPAPAEVRVVDVVNGSDNSTVTIEWTPPTAFLVYTTRTSPAASPAEVAAVPSTTDPVQMDIIVEYNVNYTITVSIETCAGPRQATTTVFIESLLVNCGVPTFPTSVTTEGAMVTIQCGEGLLSRTSTCTDTGTGGQWLPDPAGLQCSDTTSSTTTLQPNAGATGTIDTTVFIGVVVACGVVMFVLGCAAGGTIVGCCCGRARAPREKPQSVSTPAPVTPLYDDVVSTQGQFELKLNNNVAYGQVK